MSKKIILKKKNMNQARAVAIPRVKTVAAVKFAVLVGVVSLAPFFLGQMITGPLVNAILFITVVMMGTQAAIAVALVPSLVSLSTGLLPPVLAPMIPFIMFGNVMLIFTFDYFRKKNFWLGIVAAALVKYVFLFSTSSVVIGLLLKKEIASQVALMMSYPQLLTALVGGVIAYLFLVTLTNKGSLKSNS